MDHQSTYKCIKPNIPAATNAIFVQNEAGNLAFREYIKDDRDSDESGYNGPGTGDSGSPYWKYERNLLSLNEDDVRGTLVAIHNTSPLIPFFLKNRYEQCRITATKITEGILQWIKLKGAFSLKIN